MIRRRNVPLLVDREVRLCLVKGCDNKHYSRGVCHKHLERLRIHGSLTLPEHQPRPCAVDGCDRVAESRRLCKSHYVRLRTHGEAGSAEFRPRMLDGRIGYSRARRLLNQARGRADEHTCIECTKTATRWTLTEDATVYRATSGPYAGLPYSDNAEHYEPRCTKHATAWNDEHGFGRGQV